METMDNADEWSDEEFYRTQEFQIPADRVDSHSNAITTPTQGLETDDDVPLATLYKTTVQDGNSSSDDVPLATIREHLKRTACQESPASSVYDDSANDEDYLPSGSDDESDVVVAEVDNGKRKRKWWRKRNRNVKRNESFRQKKKRKRKIPDLQTNKNNEDDLETAIQNSKKECNVHSILKKYHKTRLDNLLMSNNLQIIGNIESDGDCFFNAVLCQIKTVKDVKSLRLQICNHLNENTDHYICYMTRKYTMSEEEASSLYKEKVKRLETKGIWNQELSDVIPLATANIFHHKITIYSSRLNNPVLQIEPDLEGSDTSASGQLLLAYLAVRGYEHYDACAIKQCGSSTIHATVAVSSATGIDTNAHMNTVSETPSKKNTCNVTTPPVTPRKQAEYKSPEKKKRTRKRAVNKTAWKNNIRKQKRNTGQSYFSPTSKRIVSEKTQQFHDCSKCRYKCSEHIRQETREDIFKHYYDAEMTFERKRDFICQYIEVNPTDKRNRKTYKQNARSYFLPQDGSLIRVCKPFFISTLGVSDKLIRCTLAKKQHGTFKGHDNRGKHRPGNRTSNENIEYVKKHIESFPVIESHYKRRETHRHFLGQDLSVNKMYDLYKEKCHEEMKRPVSSSVYRHTFCTEFNLSFHRPKKDTCDFCNAHFQRQEAGVENETEDARYKEHLERKKRARAEKEKDKEQAKANKLVHAVTFDLQAVLYTPCSNVSKVFYKRKLNCYNLSVFSLADRKGTCYLWDESQGQRGSSEIGTCLITYLNGLPPSVKHVILFSDCCTGQNRNQYVAAGLYNTVINHPTLETIEQKFLESGHTQMECDSMHSAIEHAKKATSIFIPHQWDTVVHMARRNKPYIVIPMRYDNFLDLENHKKTVYQGFKVDDNGNRVNWLKIKVLRVTKLAPDSILVKESFADQTFRVIPIAKSTRGRPQTAVISHIRQKYQSKLPISVAKKKDLLSLCDSLVIPPMYKPFYQSLTTSHVVRDRLPMPDTLEEEADSE